MTELLPVDEKRDEERVEMSSLKDDETARDESTITYTPQEERRGEYPLTSVKAAAADSQCA